MNASLTPVTGSVYSAEESPDMMAGKVDSAYDQAVVTPPPGGWTAEQQDKIDEINTLEAKGELTVPEQIRLLELKLGFATEIGTLTPEEAKHFNTSLINLKSWLDKAMTSGYSDVGLMNDLMAQFEFVGINTAGSPLAAKRDALLSNPDMNMADSLRFHAQHHTQMAESYEEGSTEREKHLNSAAYLNDAADMLTNQSGNLGTTEIKQFENITFSQLDAIDQDMLEAEAAFFGGLAEARESALRAQHAGNPDIEKIISEDPLLNYYRGREALANDTAAVLAEGGSALDVLNVRMDYFSKIAKMDVTFHSAMADLAKHNGDADAQRKFESLASDASDREGQINRSWQALVNILSQGMIDANK